MIRRIPAAVIVLLVVGACAGPSNHATDMPQLIERLTATGLTLEELGSRSPMPGFGSGEGLLLDGERLTAFEYSDEASAEASAARLSPDGSSVTNIDSVTGRGTGSAVDWVARPHFYRSGTLIVLYAGRVDAVTEALEAALGPQFAGSPPRP